MIDTIIDEAVLEDLLARVGDEIPVPADGPDNVLDACAATQPTRRDRTRLAKPIAISVAAAAVVIGLLMVPIQNSNSSSKAVSANTPLLTPAPADNALGSSARGATSKDLAVPAPAGSATAASGTGGSGSAKSATANAPAGPTDGAKIVKTGTLDLEVPHATLRVAVNRVTGVAVGLGGYVADSKTTYDGSDPSAQITIRVPVGNFETAVAHLDALPGVKVVGDSENGADVTRQYTDLQAQLAAATDERNAFLVVLSHAQSIADILAVHDRVTTAQTEVNELQGQINVLNDQASFSSLAVTLSETPAHATPTAVHHAAPTGLAKSWSDARSGFADSIEWLIARSGAALIVLLAALALLFGVRYLYPIVRRGLV